LEKVVRSYKHIFKRSYKFNLAKIETDFELYEILKMSWTTKGDTEMPTSNN